MKTLTTAALALALVGSLTACAKTADPPAAASPSASSAVASPLPASTAPSTTGASGDTSTSTVTSTPSESSTPDDPSTPSTPADAGTSSDPSGTGTPSLTPSADTTWSGSPTGPATTSGSAPTVAADQSTPEAAMTSWLEAMVAGEGQTVCDLMATDDKPISSIPGAADACGSTITPMLAQIRQLGSVFTGLTISGATIKGNTATFEGVTTNPAIAADVVSSFKAVRIGGKWYVSQG